eukprot:763129-Hanusia_phi.AAC.5
MIANAPKSAILIAIVAAMSDLYPLPLDGFSTPTVQLWWTGSDWIGGGYGRWVDRGWWGSRLENWRERRASNAEGSKRVTMERGEDNERRERGGERDGNRRDEMR